MTCLVKGRRESVSAAADVICGGRLCPPTETIALSRQPIIPYPTGRASDGTFQAFHAWLPSSGPSGTKAGSGVPGNRFHHLHQPRFLSINGDEFSDATRSFMEDFLLISIPVLIAILAVGITLLVIGVQLAKLRKRRQLLQHGEMAVARVVTIAQTGTSINDVPEMRLVVDVERAGEPPRRITFAQLIDLGSMPRAGERVYILVDPKDPNRATLAPSPSGAGIKVTTVSTDGGSSAEIDLSHDNVRDVVALSPRLREHGKLGIAKVVSISSTATTATQLVLDIDSIGVAPRRVIVTQIIDGAPPDVGERVYILVDSDDQNLVALLPASMTNGQRIPAMANRLDPLVLGTQILQDGAKATGTIVSAVSQPMNNPALEAKGCSKWQLLIDVKPEDGSSPYQATLVISFTTPEKAGRAARVGAEVPLRYDPLDRQTFAIDSIAMGYGDPYEAVRQMLLPG
jgi:hypothetical protein